MTSFEALVVSKTEEGQSVEWKSLTETDLMEGDVTIRVTHSTLNYKDGLALTGKTPVIRRWPMIPGVDFAGIVTSSTHENFKAGEEVFLNGCGLGEMHYGGYSQYARVPGDWLLHVPEGLSRADCMTIGTAGYSSMLAVMALQDHDVSPNDGPILVTGASGGVGSVAVLLLAKLGYSVTASTGHMEIANALKMLGAKDVLPRSEFSGTPRPLAKERWAGAVDVVGSTTLANILSQTQYGGVVAACGLVQGIDLPTTVAPFILRGVTLVGIDSVMTPKVKREAAWNRLAQDLDIAKLRALTKRHPLKDVIQLAPEIVAGRVKGRVLFELDDPEKAEEKPEVVVSEEVKEGAEVEVEVSTGVEEELKEELKEEVTAETSVTTSDEEEPQSGSVEATTAKLQENVIEADAMASPEAEAAEVSEVVVEPQPEISAPEPEPQTAIPEPTVPVEAESSETSDDAAEPQAETASSEPATPAENTSEPEEEAVAEEVKEA